MRRVGNGKAEKQKQNTMNLVCMLTFSLSRASIFEPAFDSFACKAVFEDLPGKVPEQLFIIISDCSSEEHRIYLHNRLRHNYIASACAQGKDSDAINFSCLENYAICPRMAFM